MAPNGTGPTIALQSFGQLPSSSANIPLRPVDFKREAERLRTYENWPVAFLEGKRMAEAGFYYTRKSDLVKCAFCGIEIGKWEEGDDPIRDHLRWKPHCAFLKNLNVGNVPIAQESTTPPSSQSPEQKSYDTCGPYGIEVRPFSGPENELCQPSLEHLGVNKATAPIHKSFITCETRLKSFENWPVSMKQKPDILSDAGFFYTGTYVLSVLIITVAKYLACSTTMFGLQARAIRPSASIVEEGLRTGWKQTTHGRSTQLGSPNVTLYSFAKAKHLWTSKPTRPISQRR